MAPRRATLAETVVVDRFWRNRRGEAVVTQLRDYQGQTLVDVRIHFTDKEGKLLPTSKGLSCAVIRLPDLAAAIVKALAKARELGLVDTAEPRT